MRAKKSKKTVKAKKSPAKSKKAAKPIKEKKPLSRPVTEAAPEATPKTGRKPSRTGMIVDMLLERKHTDPEIYEAVKDVFGPFDKAQVSICRCDLNDGVHIKYTAKKEAVGFQPPLPQLSRDENGELTEKCRR